MNIVIVGLGIIGGSYAKALMKYTNHRVIGINRSPGPLEMALKTGAIHEAGTAHSLETADMVILTTYPSVAVKFIQTNGHYIPPHCIVTDAAGIKGEICPQLKSLAGNFGFTFVGCHPMAGKTKSGFSASDADLFQKASLIITPCGANEDAVNKVVELSKTLGFGRITFSTPKEHDRMIAFTSQLPHILASAYVLSPQCPNHKGFSAGSYRDVSRVASINETLWSELFLENREMLLSEIDIFINNIITLKKAIEKNNKEEIENILRKSREVKEALGE